MNNEKFARENKRIIEGMGIGAFVGVIVGYAIGQLLSYLVQKLVGYFTQ